MKVDGFATQIASGEVEDVRTVTTPGRLWGSSLTEEKYKRPARDDEIVKRRFKVQAPLLRVLFCPRKHYCFILILDGYPVPELESHELEFRIAPEELGADKLPITEVQFSLECTRNGMHRQHAYASDFQVCCTFASRDQLNAYLDTSARKLQKTLVLDDVEYCCNSNGEYESEDGSILPWLIVTYLLLGSDDREAFVAVHPEMQDLLSEHASTQKESPEEEDEDDEENDD